jgi:outer membrane protein
MRLAALLSVMLCGPCVLGAAVAQDLPARAVDDTDLGKDRITIAVGPAITPRYIGSRDMTVIPGVAVQGQVAGYSFSTQGTSLSVDLIPDDGKPGWKLQVGPILNVRLDRTSRIGNRQVAALGDLKTAWEPGVWAGIQRTGVVTSPYDTLSANVTWQHDISGAYGGSVFSPAISYATPLSHKDYVSLSAGADHVGRRFGAYYYDVTAPQSLASGLRAYDGAGKAGWKDWNLALLAAHTLRGTLTHGFGVFGTIGYSRLLGSYARSPIVADVGKADQWSGAVGFSLTF